MASFERLAWKLMEVLLVATGEMAAAAESHLLQNVANSSDALVVALLAAESHLLQNVANSSDALVVALLGVDQQLPNPIQAEGSLEQRCSGLKNLAADLLNLQWCFGVLGAPVQQVDGCLVPRFPFGDGQRFCRWISKATDQGLHQLLRCLCLL